MGFTPITIDKYVKKHLKSNPSTNEKELRKGLKSALNAYKNGVKCACGNDIWVIASASVGNKCFTCITGEAYPTDDYEIKGATEKAHNLRGRHISEIPPTKIAGFFDDDGYEINTDLIKKPSLCLTCLKNDDPHEEFLCNMTRYDQQNSDEFRCGAYQKIDDNSLPF